MAESTTTATTATAPAAAVAAPAPQGRGGAPGQGRGGPQGGRGGNDRRGGRRPEVPQEEKQFDERTLHIDRVARVVKGGRRFRFRALVVVGDRKGRVGIGMAKGADVTAAVTKATEVAKKHFITVKLHKGTFPHETEAKVSGARILLRPASAGTGLIAGGVVRTILEVGGVTNALSKSLGSSNKANTAYATIAALESLVPASQWVTTVNKPKSEKVVKAEKTAPAKVAATDAKAAKASPEAKASKESK
ncbi:30S ribosomal protein S5 [Aeromicrobium sp.]|nr:30S ribosomal protein S5 [Candidatus Saccharibacteria bacterium]